MRKLTALKLAEPSDVPEGWQQMKSKTPKVILFIVEGPTDESTLSPVLKRIFESEKIRFHVVYGDLTSELSTHAANVKKTVNEHIKAEMRKYGYSKSDMLKVIHIIDTDGAFIPDTQVKLGTCQKIKYFKDEIESAEPQKTIQRNHRKSESVRRVYTAGKMGGVPYALYYLSRNLEHVIHNKSEDLTDNEKVLYADNFSCKYENKSAEFKAFISSKDFAVEGEYLDTWKFINEGTNSLHRHSNLHLIFEETK